MQSLIKSFTVMFQFVCLGCDLQFNDLSNLLAKNYTKNKGMYDVTNKKNFVGPINSLTLFFFIM